MSKSETGASKPRWQILDAIRGLSICLMVLHHLFYDLYHFDLAPVTIFHNPLFDFLHYLFLGVFIVICGACCRFSHSNVKRGLKLLVCALLLSAGSQLIGDPIRFGILHFFSLCILFYAAIERLTDRIPLPLLTGLYLALFAGSWYFIDHTSLNWKILWFFGKPEVWPVYSADYVQIFPWLFVFLLGSCLGRFLQTKTPPPRKNKAFLCFLETVGKWSLWIYLIHLPVLYGLVWLLTKILGH